MSILTGNPVIKDPNAASWPKGIDYTNYLADLDAAETISSSTWAIYTPSGVVSTSLVSVGSSIVAGQKKTQIKLSGGVLGTTYTVTNSITTSSGVIDDRSFFVKVEQQ